MAKSAGITNLPAGRKCLFETCERLVGDKGAKGLCSAHYKQSKVGELRPIIRKIRHVPGAVCSVDGCETRDGRFSSGMCSAHYQRSYRYGDPNILLKTPDGVAAAWLRSMVGFAGQECLIWPFGIDSNGYPGKCAFDGAQVRGHRAMCVLANGHPPFPKAEAAHSCGNGSGGCCHPLHLSWKTHSENMSDCEIHGTRARGERMPQAKLTAALAIAIYQSSELNAVLARRYGVAQETIRAIKIGRNWRSVTAAP